MSTTLALIRMAFQRQLTYRTATVAALATNAFFGALRAYVLIALFGARQSVAGYSLPAGITYTGLTQALIGFIGLWGWLELIFNIRTGDIASDLSRPVNFIAYWGAQDIGRGLAQLLMRGIPMMLLYALVYPILLPPSALHWVALVVSLAFALAVSFAWRFLYSLLAFWTSDAIGIARFATGLTVFLSGFLMPVAFMPDWMVAAMRLTPFPAMVNTPIEIYLGIVNGADLFVVLVEQVMWALILLVIAQLILNAGIKKLVIQGG